MKHFGLLCLCILAGCVGARGGEPGPSDLSERIPISMVALGDSITAAAFADTAIPTNFLTYVGIWMGLMDEPFRPRGEMRAMKDESSVSWIVERKSLSWSTGEDYLGFIQPVREQLEDEGFKVTKAENLAVSGFTVGDVVTISLPKYEDWIAKNGGRAPNVATLLIGANDICTNTVDEMTSVADFRAGLARILDRLVAGHRTRVLLAALPKIESLRDVAIGKKYFASYTCEDVWNTLKMCPTLTDLTDPDARAIVTARVAAYDQVMSELALERGSSVIFAAHVHDVDFTDSDLAADCFHPNSIGQRKLAAALGQALREGGGPL